MPIENSSESGTTMQRSEGGTLIAEVLAIVVLARVAALLLLPQDQQSYAAWPNAAVMIGVGLFFVAIGGVAVSAGNNYRHPRLIRLAVIAWGVTVYAVFLAAISAAPHSFLDKILSFWR